MTYIDPAAKLFQHLDRLQGLKTGLRLPPVNVEIDLSNRCSLGCEWCHFAYTHTRGPLTGKRAKPEGAVAGGDLMEVGLAKSIVDQLANAGVPSVTWTGGGEPTLHPAFDEIVEYTDLKLHQGIYTHGGHIDAARAELLKRTMTFVFVSLDAKDAKSYQRDKGVDRFDLACQGIVNLAAAEGDATIGVGFLITEQNWRGAHAMALLAARLGADYAQFRPTILYDQDAPDRPAEDLAWMSRAVSFLRENFAQLPHVEIDLDRFTRYQAWDGHGYETCWWSGMQSVITPNGKVWTCVNKREHPGEELGDLSLEPFVDVWGRQMLARVNGNCRLMCRGHSSNLALDEIMKPRPHSAFV